MVEPATGRSGRLWERPLNRALGIVSEQSGGGYARFRIEPAPASADGAGSVHSFAITTAMDLCVIAAVVTAIERGREETNGTAEMNITYLRAPEGAVTVSGRVLDKGSHLVVVDLDAHDAAGRHIAKGRGSYAIRPLAKASTA